MGPTSPGLDNAFATNYFAALMHLIAEANDVSQSVTVISVANIERTVIAESVTGQTRGLCSWSTAGVPLLRLPQ